MRGTYTPSETTEHVSFIWANNPSALMGVAICLCLLMAWAHVRLEDRAKAEE